MKHKKLKFMSINDAENLFMKQIDEFEKKYANGDPNYDSLCKDFYEFNKLELVSLISYLLLRVGNHEHSNKT